MSVAHPRTPLETVIDALAARGKKPRGNEHGWAAQCPAHDDTNPSLSVSTGNDQRALVHCHVGCTTTEILAALDLQVADLFATPRTNGNRQIEDARYRYVDENGDHLFDVIRYWTDTGKTFRQQAADGTWTTRDIRKVPYRLPELVEAVADGVTVFVVEGEKDVHALERAGYVATTNPGGAGKWSTTYNRHFQGADVVIVTDRDQPGRDHARFVAQQLGPVAASVRLTRPTAGKDISDHLAAGHTVEELVLSIDEDETLEDAPDEETREPTSWAPIDLTDALAGVDIPPPELWHRSDGVPLIYKGRIHWFQGESESCKSWAAQIIVADQLTDKRPVLYIDYEDDDRGVVARLLALGVPPDAIAAHLTYVRPDEALRDNHGRFTDAWMDLVDVLDARTYQLCVIDGVTEALTVEGLELISNTDIAAWMRLLPKRISTTGASVICIDHVVKNGENQGRYAIGGQHKLAGVTGAVYRFTALRPLSRALTDPIAGSVAVTVMKDRPGYIRSRSPEGKVGTLTITSYPDGGITAAVDPHNTAAVVDMTYAGRILKYLSLYDGSTKTRIEEAVEGKAQNLRNALSWLIEKHWVSVEQKGQSHLHWLTPEGREEVPET